MKRSSFVSIFSCAALAFAALLPVGVVAAAEDSAWKPDAAKISLPDTVPSLDGFKASDSGTWTLVEGARIIAPADELTRAQMLSTELGAFLGSPVPAVAGAAPTNKDVELIVDTQRSDLGNEGFELKVGEHGVQAIAAKDAGVFYATRTISQLLRQESRGDQQLTLPAGSVISVPKYQQRGVILCACQINISPEWIERFLDDAADLHINQILMEMKVKSENYPDTNTWSYYTKEDVKRFVEKANKLNIDVIPEINSPGHMGIWLENTPQYQLVKSNGQYSPERLDISKPEARAFIKKLIDEYDGVFTTKYWHMGADEYMINDSYSNYPQLAEYAKQSFGEGATADDAFNAFINEINTYVKSKGKTLRIFNDGVHRNAKRKIDKDVIIDYWVNKDFYTPQQFADDGYTLMNTTQSLYWSRLRAYGVNPQNLYNSKWNVGTFDGGKQIDPNYDKLLGARISLWPDTSIMTENEVTMQTSDSIAFLAQMTWSASNPWPKWEGADGMKAAIDKIGTPYMRSAVAKTDLPNGVYALSELKDVAAGSWNLTKTYDGYYQVKNVASNKCLTIDRDAAKHLNAVTEVGAKAKLADCADISVQYAQRSDASLALTHQKWQVVQRSADKVSLRNAITNQYLAIADGKEQHVDIQGVSADAVKNNAQMLSKTLSKAGNHVAAGTAAQFPHDLVSTDGKLDDNALFTMAREKGMVADSDAVTDVNPSAPQDITLTLYAPSGKDIAASSVRASVSEGWKILPDTDVVLPKMPANSTATAKFKVQNITSTTGTATFTWKVGDETLTSTVSLSGIVGPRLCGAGFEDISASSEEKVGEGAVNGHIAAAFDVKDDGTANENTFWHTKWQGGNDSFPFWVVFNPTQALNGKNMTTIEYRPRVGKVNGRINTYKVYLSKTKLAGNAAGWGEAVVSGKFENNADWQTITMPANTEGQYVKIEITDVHDEKPGQEDSFASAAAFCVASQVKPADMTAPIQPENPVKEGEKLPDPSTAGEGESNLRLALSAQSISGTVGSAIEAIEVGITADKAQGYSLDFSPALPAGVNYTDGKIQGTPTEAFSGDITVTLTQGSSKVTQAFTLTIKAATPDIPGDDSQQGGDSGRTQSNIDTSSKADSPKGAGVKTTAHTGSDVAWAAALAFALLAGGALLINRRRFEQR
ncbi:Beta-N-acetylhexosaminidase precursor [Chlamydia trachomatis]|nr:Beta-N-acetylhexosaminidase precursor [Chlamydia trachomatis]